MKVYWTLPAERDYAAAFEFSKGGGPRVAISFARRVARQLQLLERHPFAGVTGRVPTTREFFVPRTRYFAVYRVEEERVMILRFLHQAQEWPPS